MGLHCMGFGWRGPICSFGQTIRYLQSALGGSDGPGESYILWRRVSEWGTLFSVLTAYLPLTQAVFSTSADRAKLDTLFRETKFLLWMGFIVNKVVFNPVIVMCLHTCQQVMV